MSKHDMSSRKQRLARIEQRRDPLASSEIAFPVGPISEIQIEYNALPKSLTFQAERHVFARSVAFGYGCEGSPEEPEATVKAIEASQAIVKMKKDKEARIRAFQAELQKRVAKCEKSKRAFKKENIPPIRPYGHSAKSPQKSKPSVPKPETESPARNSRRISANTVVVTSKKARQAEKGKAKLDAEVVNVVQETSTAGGVPELSIEAVNEVLDKVQRLSERAKALLEAHQKAQSPAKPSEDLQPDFSFPTFAQESSTFLVQGSSAVADDRQQAVTSIGRPVEESCVGNKATTAEEASAVNAENKLESLPAAIPVEEIGVPQRWGLHKREEYVERGQGIQFFADVWRSAAEEERQKVQMWARKQHQHQKKKHLTEAEAPAWEGDGAPEAPGVDEMELLAEARAQEEARAQQRQAWLVKCQEVNASLQQVRFTDALMTRLANRARLQGAVIPPLCACGHGCSPLDLSYHSHCANNCPLRRNPEEYHRTLLTLLAALGLVP